jgi:hypothetical protein
MSCTSTFEKLYSLEAYLLTLNPFNPEDAQSIVTIKMEINELSLQLSSCLASQPPIKTAFNISGSWLVKDNKSAIIHVNNNQIWIDMSALGRPGATGIISDGSDIVVHFPDDTKPYLVAKLTDKFELVSQMQVDWSDHTAWFRNPEVAAPPLL